MTTTATHTPGPWTYRPCTIGHPNNRRNPIVSSEGNYIARVCSQESTLPGMTSRAPDAATAEANARLIAAAPALLVACRAALEYWDNGTPIHPGALIVDDFRAAIAQAEPVGEQ